MNSSSFKSLLTSNLDLQIENYLEELKYLRVEDLDSLLYYIWRLPKWKKQVRTIQLIVENLTEETYLPFIKEISKQLETVESDRKDKFYYLLNLLLNKVSITKDNLELILSYARNNTLAYYWRIILNRGVQLDKDWIVQYIAYCPPHILYLFEGVELDTPNVRQYLKRDNLNYSNRGFLNQFLKNNKF